MKKWRREWKLELIERNNPRWRDLHEDLLRGWPWTPACAGMTRMRGGGAGAVRQAFAVVTTESDAR
jgi:hypothetical protein